MNSRLDFIRGGFVMDNSSSNSDDEWRKKGVEFKIIDEGEKKLIGN